MYRFTRPQPQVKKDYVKWKCGNIHRNYKNLLLCRHAMIYKIWKVLNLYSDLKINVLFIVECVLTIAADINWKISFTSTIDNKY